VTLHRDYDATPSDATDPDPATDPSPAVAAFADWLDPSRDRPFAEAVVDLEAVRHNVSVIGRRTGVAVMAVVKADAFGHGLVPVAQAALTAGATWLGITSSAEAITLRESGIDVPMLTWLHRPDEDFGPLLDAGVDVSAASVDHLYGIARSVLAGRSSGANRKAYVHLKVDTGMSRNGATADEWPYIAAAAHELERDGVLRVRGVWTHLATADEPDRPEAGRQIAGFDDALKAASAAGLAPDVRHVANSAAALAIPESHYDLVRVGIGAYGVEPVIGRAYGLRPAMTLRARAILVKRVPAGTGVSYGSDYTTDRATTLVLVPLGYADGIPRNGSPAAEVWMNGRRHPIAGRISMDQFVIDVGDTPTAMGDEIVVFGPGDRGEPTVAEWADRVGTNPHEILTRVGPRVPRQYVGSEESARPRVSLPNSPVPRQTPPKENPDD
jgi:alanine racemase